MKNLKFYYSEPDSTGDLERDLLDPEADLLGEFGPCFEDFADPERERCDDGEPDLDLKFAGEPFDPDRDLAVLDSLDPERDRSGDDGALDPDFERDPAGDFDLELERDLDPESADLERDLETLEPERDLD